jgi:hypothetical protein
MTQEYWLGLQLILLFLFLGSNEVHGRNSCGHTYGRYGTRSERICASQCTSKRFDGGRMCFQTGSEGKSNGKNRRLFNIARSERDGIGDGNDLISAE